MTDIQIRPMTQQDIPLGMKLKSLARWNQQELDWQLLLNSGKGGNFVATYKGAEAGTVTTLSYQNRFSWIGMVLVDPEFRGLGIGTKLLKEAIKFAQTKGTVRLDATPQGKKLYETMGFKTERNLLRLERKSQKDSSYIEKKLLNITEGILPEINYWDKQVYGADRGVILGHLVKNFPQYCFYTTQNKNIKIATVWVDQEVTLNILAL